MQTIAARKTQVQLISKDEGLTFVAENHRQGLSRPGANLKAYGLLYEDNLVAVALFSNPRTPGMQKRYTTELFRLAFAKDTRIQGGTSKLIKHFLSTGPWDLFTYQDSSGENTAVYEKSGLMLVEKAKPKEILVRGGISYEDAENNRRDWFSLEQVTRYGPDALLGTSIGEVFRDDGSRKSNIDIFIEELSYRKVLVPGDNIYEWRNPNVSFYTYRITSATAEGYYVGRHLVKKAVPTIDDCVEDGYMGSGGIKFKEWKAIVGEQSLVKDILGIYRTWEEVVEAERLEIGDSYKDDILCMNYQPGGTGLGRSVSLILKKNCSTHGTTAFNGKSCMKCASSKIFKKNSCLIHGETLFRGNSCEKCKHSTRVIEGVCDIHGKVKLLNGRCIRCQNAFVISKKACPIHGNVLHFGDTCASCTAQNSVSTQNCSIHGVTKHQGDKCSKCNSLNSVSLGVCEIHGRTKHQGSHCMKCNAAAQLTTKKCSIHGEVIHKGNSCTACTASKAVSMKQCSIHGETKHQGEVCNLCNAQKSVNLKDCPKHGLTKHQGPTCSKCNSQRSVVEKDCPKHGLTKFQGTGCVKCRNEALITVKDCPVHGAWKHRGKTCYACMSDRRKAKAITSIDKST